MFVEPVVCTFVTVSEKCGTVYGEDMAAAVEEWQRCFRTGWTTRAKLLWSFFGRGICKIFGYILDELKGWLWDERARGKNIMIKLSRKNSEEVCVCFCCPPKLFLATWSSIHFTVNITLSFDAVFCHSRTEKYSESSIVMKWFCPHISKTIWSCLAWHWCEFQPDIEFTKSLFLFINPKNFCLICPYTGMFFLIIVLQFKTTFSFYIS